MLWNQYVFGPIHSRRHGRSLGINLLPLEQRTCNFHCPYCEIHDTHAKRRHWPTVAEVESQLRAAIEKGDRIDTITLAGNGEPTLHPEFPLMVAKLSQVRKEANLEAPIVLLTNGTRLHQTATRYAVSRYVSETVIKVDAVEYAVAAAINGLKSPAVFKLGLQSPLLMRRAGIPTSTQTLFCSYQGVSNDNEEHLKKWLLYLEAVRPEKVYIYSIARTPEFQAEPVSRLRLKQIADRVRKLGLTCSVA